MRVTLITLALCVLLVNITNQACAPKDVLEDLGLTLQEGNPNKVNPETCVEIYKEFGSCVADQKKVEALINAKVFTTVRMLLRKMTAYVKLNKNLTNRLNNLKTKLDKIEKNPAIANTNVVPPPTQTQVEAEVVASEGGDAKQLSAEPVVPQREYQTAAPQQTTTTTRKKPVPPTAKDNEKPKIDIKAGDDSTKKPTKNAKDMNLTGKKAAVELLQKELEEYKAVSDKFTDVKAREECEAVFSKIIVGSLCVLTSGQATDFTAVDGTAKTGVVTIKDSDAEAFAAKCLPILSMVCKLKNVKKTTQDLLKKVSNDDNSKQTKFCNNLAAATGCLLDVSKCSIDLKREFLKVFSNPIAKEVKDDVDVQELEDDSAMTDIILTKTIEEAEKPKRRRLQTTEKNTYDFNFASTGAVSLTSIADGSGVDVSNLEASISGEIPTEITASTTTTTTGKRGSILSAIILSLVFINYV